MSTPTRRSVKGSRETLERAINNLNDIQKAVYDDEHMNIEEKGTISGMLTSQRSAVLEKKKSFTGARGIVYSLVPDNVLPQGVQLKHAQAQAVETEVKNIKKHWENISENAKKRAQMLGTSDSTPAESSLTSGNSTNVTINRKLYNVTADDKFTYNSAPSSLESPSNVPFVPHTAQLATNAVSAWDHSLDSMRLAKSSSRDSRSDRRSAQQAAGTHHAPSKYPSPVHSPRISDSESHRHYTNPSMSSNMSDPPRAPSSVSIRPSLPAPPRKQRRQVETIVAPEVDALPSSTTEQLEGEPYDPEQLYWDDQSITMPRDSLTQAGHQRTYSSFLSIESTEEGHGRYENFDESAEY